MANTKVTQHVIANNAITADQLASAAVTDAKLHATLDLSGKTLTLPATAIPSASTATTQAASDNSTKLATTAYVTTALANLVDSSPSSLNTLNELAAALNDDASFSTTVTNSIATKLPLAGGTLTGALTLSGAPTNALHPATKTYTDTADALKLNLSGGTLTGDLILNTTTALQIPAGTTGQRPSAATAQIRWNTTDGALEVYNGSAWTAVGTGSSNKVLNTFTGDGSTTTFALTVTPANEDALMVFIDGAYQEAGDYVLTNNQLALDVAPLSGEKVSAHITTASVHDGTSAVNQQFTASGGQTVFTLSQDPKSENNTQVYINGVYQQKTDYTVVGTTLTFDTGVTAGDIVEVNMFTVATLGNTDTVTEGVGNLYHTTARARAAISAGTGVSYNSSTGVITSSGPSGYSSSGDDITLSADSDNNASNTAIKFELDGSEMARFTKSSDGGLLFGQQSAYSTYTFGAADSVQIMSNKIMAASNASTSGVFSRYTNSGGDVIDFRRGTTSRIGYIGITNDSTATQAGLYIGGGVIQETTIRMEGSTKAVTPGSGSSRARSNNTTDLGLSDARWKDFYIGNDIFHLDSGGNARTLYDKSTNTLGNTSTAISSGAITSTGTSTFSDITIGATGDSQSLIQMLANSTNGANTIHFGDAASGTSLYTGYINYAHDTNQMQFATNGGNIRMRIDSAGLVSMTHAAGAHTGGLSIINSQAGGYGSSLTFQSERSDDNSIVSAAQIRTQGQDSWNSAASADSNLFFATALNGSLTDKMVIKHDGAVGIGTGSPTEELHVNSDVSGQHTRIHVTKTSTAGTAGISFNTTSSTNTWTLFQEDASASKFYVYDGANYVGTFDSANNRFGVNNQSPSEALDVSGNTYVSGDSTINGAFHLKGAYQSAYNSTYLGSEYMARGLVGDVLHKYVHYDSSWNASTETKNIFEVSHDSANWGNKYIMIEVRQTQYNGGGYARYYLNHQYNQNSLVQFEKGGNNSSLTAQMTSLTTVSGNTKKSTFQLVMGYYMQAIVTVTSNMTASTSITGNNQLRFL